VTYTHVALDAGDAHRRAAVRLLLDRCELVDGRPPLGDHALVAVTNGQPDLCAIAVVDASSQPVGYAQATASDRRPPTWTIDIAIDPDHRDDHGSVLEATLGAVLAQVDARGGQAVQWWCHEPTDVQSSIAEHHGLLPTRQLLQMHLDVEEITDPPAFTTRSFVQGVDDAALLEVNNLAFEHHPDQGSWTLESLTGRFESDWFDPVGLLIHDDADGTIIGFCWTKIHRSVSHNAGFSATGEIYVVAVRPDAGGRGLGRALTHAGVASLRDRGVGQVMLFVDSANAAALRVYSGLGFTVTSSTTALQRTIKPSVTQLPSAHVALSRARRRVLR
jgi:mycothiol synthase